ncbi:MAG: hypothetical protein AABO58_23950 [Acidobacteriota bacterium]
MIAEKQRDSERPIYGFLGPDVTIALGVNKFKETFFGELLEVGTDILSLHAEMLSNLLHALRPVGGEIDLRPTHAGSEDFLHLCEVLGCFGAKGKSVCLLDRVYFVFDLCEPIENLLIAIELMLTVRCHTISPALMSWGGLRPCEHEKSPD